MKQMSWQHVASPPRRTHVTVANVGCVQCQMAGNSTTRYVSVFGALLCSIIDNRSSIHLCYAVMDSILILLLMVGYPKSVKFHKNKKSRHCVHAVFGIERCHRSMTTELRTLWILSVCTWKLIKSLSVPFRSNALEALRTRLTCNCVLHSLIWLYSE